VNEPRLVCGKGEAFYSSGAKLSDVVWKETPGGRLAVLYQLVHRQADVPGDLAQQDRRDVAPGVEGNCRRAAVGMTELLVRTALARSGSC